MTLYREITEPRRKIGWPFVDYSLRPCLRNGESLGEEAVFADSGREGEIAAVVERVEESRLL